MISSVRGVDDGEQARAPALQLRPASRTKISIVFSVVEWTANRRRSSGSCQMPEQRVDVGVICQRRRPHAVAVDHGRPREVDHPTHQVSPIVARIVASNSASPIASRVAKISSASAPTGTRNGVSGCSIASAIAPGRRARGRGGRPR